MKKSLIFASIACAGAFALHADWTYNGWFTGIGDGASGSSLPSSLDPTGGAWAFGTGDVSWDSGLVFDLDENEAIAFTVNTDAPDTNTVTAVLVSGVFTPVSTTDLPSDDNMNGRYAQVGFVVGVDGALTNYYAWTGNGWYTLTNNAVSAATGIDTTKNLLVKFDYTAEPSKASFAIVDGATTNVLGDVTGSATSNITATVAVGVNAHRYVSGVSCYGSGKLVAANGSVGIGYAEMAGVKYGSIADAIEAADGGEATITVARATEEAVTIPSSSNVTIADPDNVYAGEVDVAAGATVKVALDKDNVGSVSGENVSGCRIKATAASADQVNVTLVGDIATYKEAGNKRLDTDTSELVFDVRTKTEFITNAIPEGGKALERAPEKLHQFLADYGGSNYTKAEATTADIKIALETVSNAAGSNGLQNWECYVLGITPTTPIAPVAAATDESGDTIPLSIPAVMSATPSGDYEVKYKVNSGTAGDGIEVPASTGTHTIKIVLE